MRYATRSLAVLGVILALVLSASAGAAEDRPIAMSEVGRMIDDDQTPRQVLEVMVERGVGFRVSRAAIQRLEKWGFTKAQIGLVQKIADGEKVDLDASPDDVEAPGDNAEGKTGDRVDHDKIGYPNPAGWHKAERARIERAIETAGLGYKRIELTRCTLYCSDRRAKALVPMLRKLEADLIARFPGSIANASSPESAHIVIVDGSSEWTRWVDACFASYREDRINYKFGPDDDENHAMLKRSPGYMLPAMTATRGDKQPSAEAVSRLAAFSVGFLMMNQAGGEKQPDGLRTGFGDLAEAMAHQTPSVMVTSYGERDLQGEGGWAGVVAQRFKDKKIKDATDPWAYETSTMEVEHYAEAWSLVSTLAEAPDKFARAVETVRKQEKPMAKAINDAYGVNDRKLLEAWSYYATK
jgi:hypothetical protein